MPELEDDPPLLEYRAPGAVKSRPPRKMSEGVLACLLVAIAAVLLFLFAIFVDVRGPK